MDHYFNQVLDAFSEMNRSRLEELLEPSLTYQDVSFSAFLDGLERVFGRFRKAGDSGLEVQPGHCCSFTCNPDKIRTAYRFVGRNSRNYLDLRFILELTEDLKDHRVLDIFQCFSLKCQEPWDWYGEEVLLTFYFDEQFPEEISPEEKIHSQLALEAMRYLESLSHVEVKEATAWVQTYASTYQTLSTLAHDRDVLFSDYRWNHFLSYYRNLSAYLEVFQILQDSEAIHEIFFWELLPDLELFEKIRFVERLLEEKNAFFLLEYPECDQIKILNEETICRGGEEFDQLDSFWRKFFEVQKSLLEQYHVFTPKEEYEYSERSYDLLDYFRLRLLSFHLDYREKSQKEGKEIPQWKRR